MTAGHRQYRLDRGLERKSCGELQRAGKAVWADFLKRPEIARPRVRHQIAGLIHTRAVAAVSSDRIVLQLVDAVAILYVVVGMVEQIEGLHLKLQFFAFSNRKAPRQPDVD